MPNRLAASTSPYLLQHAHNPVDWFPWGDEAFEHARARDVPIFLSIGYSTCYWCHVMERESFEDEATARVMNDNFVCVKLDREERPDLDELYMSATVLMRGHGGWPMSVFLEPDTLRPFFCGTYFPKTPHASMRGPTFKQVLEGMSNAYRTQRQDVREQASQLAQAVEEHVGTATADDASSTPLNVETVQEALSRVLAMFDTTHGGFGAGGGPKFPQPVFLEFLLDARDAVDTDTRTALDHCVKTTLSAMAKGGVHDHLGGGFHRYSVDPAWNVPHFEKMLYDQAQLLSVYAKAAAAYAGTPEHAWYKRVCEELVAYLQREMLDKHGVGGFGGFFSAQDAEVDGREGLNYLWTPEQVREACGHDEQGRSDAAFALAAFGLDGDANFQDPHHPNDAPTWVLRLANSPHQLARELNMSDAAFNQQLQRVKATLLARRGTRKQPATDTKVLTSWNAMLACALHTYGSLLSDNNATTLAKQTVQTLLARLYTPEGLLRTARGDKAHTNAFLEDYAWIVRACNAVGMHAEAENFVQEMKQLFSTQSDAAKSTQWFDTRASQRDVFVRACATHDGATPSGFASMVHALLDTGHIEDAGQALMSQSVRVAASPAGCVESVRGLLRILRPVGTQASSDTAAAQRTAAMLANAGTQLQSTPRSAQHGAHNSTAHPDPVHIFASTERVTVSHDTPATLTLVIDIQPGYHVVAAQPWDEEGTQAQRHEGTKGLPALIPFRVGVHNGSGVAAYADYPPGQPLASHDTPQSTRPPRVYEGRFEMQVVLERTGDWQGTPLLTVQYQACTNDACMEAMVVELDIAVDRG